MQQEIFGSAGNEVGGEAGDEGGQENGFCYGLKHYPALINDMLEERIREMLKRI